MDGKIVPAGTIDVADGKPTNDNINVWIGTDGTAYFKGTIYANNGYFKGDIHADSGEFAGTIHASYLDGEITGKSGGKIVGTEICVPTERNPNFHVESNGTTTIKNGTFTAPTIYGGKICAENEPSGSFSEMNSDGFYVYVDHIDEPKVKIVVNKNFPGYSLPEIILGSGNGVVSGRNIGRWGKGLSGMTLEFIDNNDTRSGFMFKSDGKIEVLGEFENAHYVLD